MQRTVIAVRGKANTGKSSAVRLAYEALAAESGTRIASFEAIGRKGDFKAVLIVRSKKVGFYSQGDVAEWLDEELQDLIENGCGVIVCTTRTKGKTVAVVEKRKPLFEICWLEKEGKPTASHQQANSTMAHGIVQAIKSAIDA